MKTANQIVRMVEALLATLLGFMVLLTFVDVIGRHVFNQPVYGANDITEHLMALIVFAGLPLVTRVRGHLAVDLFDYHIMSPRFRSWHVTVDLLITCILGLIAYQYVEASEEAWTIIEVSPALEIPRGIAYAYIAAMSGLAAVLSAINMVIPWQPGSVEA
jgi:TRAP-type C4-dicarboxylate transport system permease small subunit